MIVMGEKHENTNLASEFFVLSMLHRKGLNPSLTLGNKKSVDIYISNNDRVKTIDVKGIKKKSNCFPVDNIYRKKNHFIIFVSFESLSNHRILENNPEVYVVPSENLFKEYNELSGYKKCPRRLIYSTPSGHRKDVSLHRLRLLGHKFYNRWDYLEK